MSILEGIIYRIKWIIAYFVIRKRSAFQKQRFDLYLPSATGDPEKLNLLVPQFEFNIESPFPETHLQEAAADEITFYGINSKSELLVVRINRKCNQIANAYIFVKLENGKNYQLVETEYYQQPFEGKCTSFSCGNLQMCYLKPMRKWRIYYCGLLKETSEQDGGTERIIFVKFVFIWSASSNVFDFNPESNVCGFSSFLAKHEWNSPFPPKYANVKAALNIYAQVGTLHGTLSVEEEEEYEIYLFGEKLRNLGQSSSITGYNFTSFLGYTPKDGHAIHLTKFSVPSSTIAFSLGFVVKPNGYMVMTNDFDIGIESREKKEGGEEFYAYAKGGSNVDITGSIIQDLPIFSDLTTFKQFSFVSFQLKNKTGLGLLLNGEIRSDEKMLPSSSLSNVHTSVVPVTVKFSDEISQFVEISGGKGSSLGKLTKLSETDGTFTVPKGLIITTSAYEEFLTSDVIQHIQTLENVLKGNSEGDVKTTCEMVSKAIINTDFPSKTIEIIARELRSIFGDFQNIKFAVRSSATGEDTDAMSAAGQMETFLGVRGFEKIILAVKKCWASQFGRIAVEYKKQNGQLLNSPMAVVIQEMVDSEISGVLFTCDPITNNPSVITITANYGLGETVVSGSVEPDTIILQRRKNDKLVLKSVKIGSKLQKIISNEKEGIVIEEISQDLCLRSCLHNEMAMNLGKLAIKIENFYRSARDIEWAVVKNEIYLLQSRPVTNCASVTDFELKHEFDAPLRSEQDYFTVANNGEVWPGTTSPLGADLALKYAYYTIAKLAYESGSTSHLAKSPYFQCGLTSFYNHMMVPATELVSHLGVGTTLSKGFMISICGRVIDEPGLLQMANERKGDSNRSIYQVIFLLKKILCWPWSLKKVKKKLYNYDALFLKQSTADDTFKSLVESCCDFDESLPAYALRMELNSIWNVMMFLVLIKANRSLDAEVYSDFARLMASSSNIESVDVPSSMQNIALQIVEDLGKEIFIGMELEEAHAWLSSSDSKAGESFRNFINKHGHRCLKEFDVHSTPWGEDQKYIARLLKTLVTSAKPKINKKNESDSQLFSELRVQLNWLHRLLLRMILPFCRSSVGAREESKSLLIKTYDHWRKGFKKLGNLMVSESRLPDAELVFFMTMDEINDLLKTRNPKYISRATARRKMNAQMEAYKFPEVMQGVPKPLNEENDSFEAEKYAVDLTMTGVPVSQGVVKGQCRVALSLEDAVLIQPGEILIAYSTDIGWSPYFPVISGVATELGGLISHGAVVCREYGLPCVVGVHGATKLFKTGDFVLLDGKKGVLQRLPKKKED